MLGDAESKRVVVTMKSTGKIALKNVNGEGHEEVIFLQKMSQ